MLNQNQTTAAAVDVYAITDTELRTACERCASIAVNRNHSASGNKMLTGVQNDKTPDRRIEATADTLSKAATMRAKAAQLEKEAKEHRRNARTSPDKLIAQAAARGEAMTWEAAEAYKDSQTAEAEAKSGKAAKLKKDAQKLENAAPVGNTFGDFQPLKHDAIVGHLITQKVYQYTVTPADIITAADKATEAAERHRCASPDNIYNAARSAAAIIASRPEYLFMEAWRHVAEGMAKKATHAAITAQLHHDVNKTTKERKTLATPAIMEAWRSVHGENSGKAYKVYVDRDNANYYTMEYRKYKTEPTGFYLVYHWKTVSPIVSLEAYAENSHRAEAEAAEHGAEALKKARAEAEEVTPEIVTNGGIPFAETQEARERLEAVADNPNFTARERKYTRYFLSTDCAHEGQKAVNATMASKEATKAAKDSFTAAKKANSEEVSHVDNWVELVRYRAMRHAAAVHVGIETEAAEWKFFSRWRARAVKGVKLEQGCPTPEEAAEDEVKQIEQMQKNRHRNTRPGEATTVLFVGIDSPEAIQAAAAQIERKAKGKHATEADKARARRAAKATRATEARAAAPVITWTESGTAPEAVNPGTDYRSVEVEARAAAQAAEAKAHGEQNRRNKYRTDNFTGRRSPAAYAAHDAQRAALVFWDALSTAAQDAIIAAEPMTYRERTEAAKRAARLAEVEALAAIIEAADKTNPGKAYTAAEVEAMKTEARARAATNDYILAEARARQQAATKEARARRAAAPGASVLIPTAQAWSKAK